MGDSDHRKIYIEKFFRVHVPPVFDHKIPKRGRLSCAHDAGGILNSPLHAFNVWCRNDLLRAPLKQRHRLYVIRVRKHVDRLYLLELVPPFLQYRRIPGLR